MAAASSKRTHCTPTSSDSCGWRLGHDWDESHRAMFWKRRLLRNLALLFEDGGPASAHHLPGAVISPVRGPQCKWKGSVHSPPRILKRTWTGKGAHHRPGGQEDREGYRPRAHRRFSHQRRALGRLPVLRSSVPYHTGTVTGPRFITVGMTSGMYVEVPVTEGAPSASGPPLPLPLPHR